MSSSVVGRKQLDEHMQRVESLAAGPLAGVFGPNSLMWRINGEAAIFLGAGRALLLQIAHPWVAAAIRDHSKAFADPVGRFHRTFQLFFTLVFGTLEQAITAARRLHTRHAAIRGVLSEDVGVFPKGTPYDANDVASLRWVHGTLIETALMAHDLVLPTLTDQERERYYGESCLLAGLFGIPRTALPSDWNAFVAYNAAMHDSDELTVSAVARELARQLMRTSGRFPLPNWYWIMTAEMLPARLRSAFGLNFDQSDVRSAQRSLKWLRRLYPMLPWRVRHVGPFQEAYDRLSGKRQPSFGTQLSNRFWIGQSWIGSSNCL
jgi:uncharacterized protein (DUF2236 family)